MLFEEILAKLILLNKVGNRKGHLVFLAKTHIIAQRLKTQLTKSSFLGGDQILPLLFTSTGTLEEE